jgi:transcriptional regulator with XRE-family HTH domain
MIGDEVRRRREELGLTGAQLAARAGLTPSAVSQIETGKRTPSSTSVIKLATGLGVEVGELYPKGQARLPLEDRTRPGGIEVGEAFFVPLEEGEEEDTVELRIYCVQLLEGDEPILKAMRAASPEEVAQAREQLEKAGRNPE